MFEPKNTEKIDSLSPMFAQNKAKLDKIMNFDPFEITDLNGLKVLKYPIFESYQKVIASLLVVDEKSQPMVYQTQDLQENMLQTCMRQAFLEMLYEAQEPTKAKYMRLLEEKLLLNLVNLVLAESLPLDQTLSRDQINLAEKTFKQMLQNV